jgi:hypothetical protein
MYFHAESPDDPTRNDGDDSTSDEIQRRHFPDEQTKEQHQRDFVHHRRGNEKRKGDSKWHAGRHKADEQRHRRAGTEGRQRAHSIDDFNLHSYGVLPASDDSGEDILYSHALSIVILDALPNCRQQRCKYERLADSSLSPCHCIIES